ncbi:cold-shock protein [Candidatus Omnitrophota bacterium]
MVRKGKGWITNYIKDKGCGFVFDKQLRTSHFVHFTDIHTDNPIMVNDEVEFDVVKTTKGTKAVNVRKVL